MALVEILDLETEVEPVVNFSSSDKQLVRLLKQWTEADARKYVGHGIAQTTYTGEFYPLEDISGHVDSNEVDLQGDTVILGESSVQSGKILQLKNGFVRSVTSLWEDKNAYFGSQDDDFASDTLLTEGDDFYPEYDSSGLCKSGRIFRKGQNWSTRPGTIKITYVAGLTRSELDDEYSFVKQALIENIQSKYNTIKSRQNEGGGPLKKVSYHGDITKEYAVEQTTLRGLMQTTKDALNPIKIIRL